MPPVMFREQRGGTPVEGDASVAYEETFPGRVDVF
jgi:hypothetical protein